MAKVTQEPKRDFGFYATIPRIVRTQYKDLSHAEKWLYVCLKDLCGDKGTCFRTLRALSEETDVSTGSLSKMIPNLHKVGLIHAEKKRRTESGKEVWHITIADIWAENAKGCSRNEQSKGEVVQNPNNVVQKMNDNSKDCSKNERDCSNFVDRRKNTEERTIIEEKTKEERKNEGLPTNSEPESFSLSSIHSSSFSSETKAEEETVTLSPEEQVVYELGSQTIFKVKRPKITPTVKGHCAEIAKAGVTTLDEMESLIAFVTKEDKRLIGKTLYLGNLVNALNGWLMAEKATKSVETLDMEAERERVRIKNAQQLELLRSRQRERAAQQNSAAQQ